MQIAVCEDKATDREALCGYINSYCEENCFVCEIHEYTTAEELLAVFQPGLFDIVFLDIYTGGITGMEAAQKIRESDSACALVFVTVSEEYLRESFSVYVTSYVVKPISPKDMAAAFASCRRLFLKNARYIEVKSGQEYVKIPLVNIVYIELENRATVFHTDKSEVRTYMPIDEAEALLGGAPFLRCHRAFIINMNCMADIEEYNFVLRGGIRVPMRKNGRRELRAAISEYNTRRMFEEV